MSKFNLYNLMNNRAKKDAAKDPDISSLNFKGFFKLAGRHFSNIFSVNLLFVLTNFPVFFGLALFIGAINDNSLAPQTLGYSTLYGATAHSEMNPLTSVLYAVSGSPILENEFNKPLLIVFIALTCLLLFTFGPANCGSAHVIRSMVRGEPIFLFKDYFSTIKKNLRQGLILGILDILFIGVIIFDISTFYMNYAYSFFYTVAFFFSIGVFLLYMFARMYMYMICITFDLSVFKIIKNSAIFAFLGIKRNILAFLGQVAAIYLVFLLIQSGILSALGILLPFILLFGMGMFMSYYASYKVIKKYMIEPYYDENGNPLEETNE